MLKISRFIFLIFFSLTVILTSCKKEEIKTNSIQTDNNKQLSSEVITQDKQNQLTPDMVLQSLKDGNKRFVDGKLTQRDYSKQVEQTSHAQYPEAIVLSCIDSRVPVEIVFDRGIGDIFVARVAGNIADADVLGSMEYSCKVSGAKLILVLGHSNRGAIKSAIDDVKLGNITGLLDKIQPSVQSFPDYKGDKSSKNYDFVDMVGKKNVSETINSIRKNSPNLKEMEDKGEIKIAGAFYDVETGKIEFFDK
jgi:carbonic anhydrase